MLVFRDLWTIRIYMHSTRAQAEQHSLHHDSNTSNSVVVSAFPQINTDNRRLVDFGIVSPPAVEKKQEVECTMYYYLRCRLGRGLKISLVYTQ